MLKAKEREVECLMAKVTEKDELLKKYYCQIEDLKKDLKNKCKKYREILKQLKEIRSEGSRVCEDEVEKEPCDSDDIGELLNAVIKNIEDQRKSVLYQLQNAESQIKSLSAENNLYLKERNEIATQLQFMRSENDKLLKNVTIQKKSDFDKEDLLKTIEVLKSEKEGLLEKVNTLHESIQELNNNFKETRWALTSEVAEKHDQVQDLKRCVGVLEEQLRQADMQTHFKDDIIKELRKELKASRKSERRGLYDIVNELRERKNECASKAKFSKSSEMNKYQSSAKGADTTYFSTTSLLDKQDTSEDKKSPIGKDKLLFEIDCLRKNLKLKAEELKEQEELTKVLEKELSSTKMDLAILQKKYEEPEQQCKSGESSTSDPNLKLHHATLVCSVNKIEEILRNLLINHSSRVSNIKAVLEAEMEKVCSIKKDLEKNISKSQISKTTEKSLEDSRTCSSTGVKFHFQSSLVNQPSSVSLEDLEKFREKSVMAAVALELMKEQIDILKNLIKKYTREFPCGCDKDFVEESEDKLDKLRAEFDKLTNELCHILQKLNKPAKGSCDTFSFDSSLNSKEVESTNTPNSCSVEEFNKLKSDYQRFQKQICDQENVAEKLKKMSKQLEEEIQQRRDQLIEHTREIDAKMCEISKLRELIRKVCRRLKEIQCDHTISLNQEADSSPGKNLSNLSGLICDMQEFQSVLEKSLGTLLDTPKKLGEDNEKLREQLCNKEKTIKYLKDTIMSKECQMEELKSKMQSSNSKLAQDVEEKCRLIANLQDAVQKSKRFEVSSRSPGRWFWFSSKGPRHVHYI